MYYQLVKDGGHPDPSRITGISIESGDDNTTEERIDINIYSIEQTDSGYEYVYSVLDQDGLVMFNNQVSFCGDQYPTDSETMDWEEQQLDYYMNLINSTVHEGTFDEIDLCANIIDSDNKIKRAIVRAIKHNVCISKEALENLIASSSGKWYGDCSSIMVDACIVSAYRLGYITNMTYYDFRQYIVKTKKRKIFRELFNESF